MCNSFKERFLDNQLCYEVDVTQFSENVDFGDILTFGLTFMVDTNNNRQSQEPVGKNNFQKMTNIGSIFSCKEAALEFYK